jgi:L-lactate dehydrogenase (cytochrome)
MQHADGEILAARAAEKFGVPFTLSTMSICSIEDVARTPPEPFWFQLYVMRDREFSRGAHRPRQGGGLLGADAHAGPADHRPAPQGPGERALGAAQAHVANIANLMTKPRWCLGMLGHDPAHLRQHRRHARA